MEKPYTKIIDEVPNIITTKLSSQKYTLDLCTIYNPISRSLSKIDYKSSNSLIEGLEFCYLYKNHLLQSSMVSQCLLIDENVCVHDNTKEVPMYSANSKETTNLSSINVFEENNESKFYQESNVMKLKNHCKGCSICKKICDLNNRLTIEYFSSKFIGFTKKNELFEVYA